MAARERARSPVQVPSLQMTPNRKLIDRRALDGMALIEQHVLVQEISVAWWARAQLSMPRVGARDRRTRPLAAKPCTGKS